MKNTCQYVINLEFCFLHGNTPGLLETVAWDRPLESKGSHLSVVMCEHQKTSVLPPFSYSTNE